MSLQRTCLPSLLNGAESPWRRGPFLRTPPVQVPGSEEILPREPPALRSFIDSYGNALLLRELRIPRLSYTPAIHRAPRIVILHMRRLIGFKRQWKQASTLGCLWWLSIDYA